MNKMKTNTDGVYLTVNVARGKYHFSRPMVMNIAEKSGALIRIGSVIRIDARKLEKYVENTFCS